jgi:peptidyl-dipeptidase A
MLGLTSVLLSFGIKINLVGMKLFKPSLFFMAGWIAMTPLFAAEAPMSFQERADHFLGLVNAGYQALYRVETQAQWLAVTDVTPAHDAALEVGSKARAAFVGNPALINEARELLKHRPQLAPLTARQLERALLYAAEGPMTNPELVAARITAETQQASTLNSFVFKLKGAPITANEIDNFLSTNRDLAARLEVWEASKQSGPALKPGLIRLQSLRNRVAQELGHPDYFTLQVASYDMTTTEMLRLQDDFMRDLKPLYVQLHTWVKYELAKRYQQPVPRLIPAHWLNNRWGQNWTGIIDAADWDDHLKNKSPEWVVKTAEHFFTSLGFEPLPASFWTLSDLYPVKSGDARRKNTHASCWHIDLDRDIRSLMSVEPNWQWFETAHHELGHAFYFQSYARPEVPPLLRTSANPAFHEAIAELAALACGSVPYLQSVGVLPAAFATDQTQVLLNDALANTVPFIFWSSGTMTHWEADLYSRNLDPGQWNARWWAYVRDFQGIEPPAPRGEEFCDAATKTHISDAPAYYHSYAVATVLKFQLHEHIAKKILKQPPQACNYANHPEVGDFLRSIMKQGATEDWRRVLKAATGEELSTRAMMEYYQPLLSWLQKQNQGRQLGWE